MKRIARSAVQLAGGRSSYIIIISVRPERPSSIVRPQPESLKRNPLRRNKTLPGLDLAYVSSAAGLAKPDGKLKRSGDGGQQPRSAARGASGSLRSRVALLTDVAGSARPSRARGFGEKKVNAARRTLAIWHQYRLGRPDRPVLEEEWDPNRNLSNALGRVATWLVSIKRKAPRIRGAPLAHRIAQKTQCPINL